MAWTLDCSLEPLRGTIQDIDEVRMPSNIVLGGVFQWTGREKFELRGLWGLTKDKGNLDVYLHNTKAGSSALTTGIESLNPGKSLTRILYLILGRQPLQRTLLQAAAIPATTSGLLCHQQDQSI